MLVALLHLFDQASYIVALFPSRGAVFLFDRGLLLLYLIEHQRFSYISLISEWRLFGNQLLRIHVDFSVCFRLGMISL